MKMNKLERIANKISVNLKTEGKLFGYGLDKDDADYLSKMIEKKWKNDKGVKVTVKPEKSKGQSISYGFRVFIENISKDVSRESMQAFSRIKKEILEAYKVGMKKIDNKVATIIYQYFDEKGVLVNRKYKNSDKSKVWTEKDAEPIYYGLQHINFEETTLYITEGEDDCHAFRQLLGINQVVSIPYGANNYTISMDKINAQFNDLVLLF